MLNSQPCSKTLCIQRNLRPKKQLSVSFKKIYIFFMSKWELQTGCNI